MPHELCLKARGVDPKPKTPQNAKMRSTLELNSTLTEIIWALPTFNWSKFSSTIWSASEGIPPPKINKNPPLKLDHPTFRKFHLNPTTFRDTSRKNGTNSGVYLKQNWANVTEQFPRKMTHFCVITFGDFGGVPDFEKLQNEMPWFTITQTSYEVKKCQEIGWISWCLKLGSYRQIWRLISIT